MSPYSDFGLRSRKMEEEKTSTTSTSTFQDLYKTLQPTPEGRVLYISRHGESMYNLDNRIGGNPSLSPRGKQYARALGTHINSLNIPKLRVFFTLLLYKILV